MPARGDVVIADLKPVALTAVKNEWKGLPFAMQRQVVFYRTTVVPGSIVVDRENRFLYLIDANNSARRYGIGIAQECLKGGNLFHVTNKLEWPALRTSDTNTKDTDALLAAAGLSRQSAGRRANVVGQARTANPWHEFTDDHRPSPSTSDASGW